MKARVLVSTTVCSRTRLTANAGFRGGVALLLLLLRRGPAREPLLQRDWVASGGDVLINAIGADSPGKQELDPALVTSAAMRVADATAQCVERGELQHAVRSAALATSGIVEMGDWLASPPTARKRPNGLIIFDSTGVAVQDAKIAELALKAAPVSAL